MKGTYGCKPNKKCSGKIIDKRSNPQGNGIEVENIQPMVNCNSHAETFLLPACWSHALKERWQISNLLKDCTTQSVKTIWVRLSGQLRGLFARKPKDSNLFSCWVFISSNKIRQKSRDQTKIELWFQIITVPWCGQCSTRTPHKLSSILLLQARGMRKGVEEWEGGFRQGQGLCVAFNNIEMNSNVKEWGSKHNRRRMLALKHSDIVGKTTATRMEKQL